jgi:hypothetical protein
MLELLPEEFDTIRAEVADMPGDMGRAQAEQELAAGELDEALHSPQVAQLFGQGPLQGMDRQYSEALQVEEIETMSDDDLLAEVEYQLKSSLDGKDGELSGNWRQALEYYNGEEDTETGGCIDQDTGRADTSSTDVADMIEATMAQLMPVFESGSVFRFGATGQNDQELSQDEKRAEDESEVVNHVLMSKNHGYITLQSMFRDALLMRGGYAKVTTTQDLEVRSAEYEDLTPQDILQIRMQPNTDVVRAGGKYLVREYRKNEQVSVESVPPEELKMSTGWHSPFLDGIPFIAHSRIVRRNELVAMGYDKEAVDAIPTESQETNEVAATRSDYSGENQYHDNLQGAEPVRYSECYVLIDYDGDGISERRKVCIGGQGHLLANQPVNRQPFALSVPILRSHRSTGRSLFDRLKSVQDIKSETLSQHVDNLRWCNMPDVDAVDSQVNISDLLARRPGGINRVKAPGAIQRNPPVPAGQDALQLLDYMDRVRSERGGASLDMQSAQLQIAGDTAHGIERQVSSKEQMASFICSTMVRTGLVPLLLKIHAELRENPQTLAIPASGRTISTNTGQWQERDVVDLTSAITIGDQTRRQAALEAIWQKQSRLLETGEGDVLVDRQGVYNMLADTVRMARLPNPAQYWVDPASPQALQALQGKQQAAQQQAMQAEQQAKQAAQMQMAMMMGLEQIKAQSAELREQMKQVTEAAKIQHQAQLEAAKLAEDGRQANQDAALKLAELNAEFDSEPVPDTTKEL